MRFVRCCGCVLRLLLRCCLRCVRVRSVAVCGCVAVYLLRFTLYSFVRLRWCRCTRVIPFVRYVRVVRVYVPSFSFIRLRYVALRYDVYAFLLPVVVLFVVVYVEFPLRFVVLFAGRVVLVVRFWFRVTFFARCCSRSLELTPGHVVAVIIVALRWLFVRCCVRVSSVGVAELFVCLRWLICRVRLLLFSLFELTLRIRYVCVCYMLRSLVRSRCCCSRLVYVFTFSFCSVNVDCLFTLIVVCCDSLFLPAVPLVAYVRFVVAVALVVRVDWCLPSRYFVLAVLCCCIVALRLLPFARSLCCSFVILFTLLPILVTLPCSFAVVLVAICCS